MTYYDKVITSLRTFRWITRNAKSWLSSFPSNSATVSIVQQDLHSSEKFHNAKRSWLVLAFEALNSSCTDISLDGFQELSKKFFRSSWMNPDTEIHWLRNQARGPLTATKLWVVVHNQCKDNGQTWKRKLPNEVAAKGYFLNNKISNEN